MILASLGRMNAYNRVAFSTGGSPGSWGTHVARYLSADSNGIDKATADKAAALAKKERALAEKEKELTDKERKLAIENGTRVWKAVLSCCSDQAKPAFHWMMNKASEILTGRKDAGLQLPKSVGVAAKPDKVEDVLKRYDGIKPNGEINPDAVLALQDANPQLGQKIPHWGPMSSFYHTE